MKMDGFIVEESADGGWSVYDTSQSRALDEWMAEFRNKSDAEEWAERKRLEG
jgi:hypothetical protein